MLVLTIFKKLLKYENVFLKKKLMFYLYLNKKIILLKLEIIKSRYINFYIIYFKRNYRSCDDI